MGREPDLDSTYWVGRIEVDWNAKPWEHPKRFGIQTHEGANFRAFHTQEAIDYRDPETMKWRQGRIERSSDPACWYFVEADHYVPLGSPGVFTVALEVGDLVRVKRRLGD